MMSSGCIIAFTRLMGKLVRVLFQSIKCLLTYIIHLLGLSFSVRTYNEPGEDGVSVPKVAYSPGIMSDNSQEFMDRLDFLADEFTFQRKQLDVFLDKVYTTLNDPQDAGV